MKRFLTFALAALLLLAVGCATNETPARKTVDGMDLFDQLAETEEQAKERIYSKIRDRLMTDAEKQEMTESERSENAALEAAMQTALQSGSREELEQRIAEWSEFSDKLRSVFSAYQKINQTPFSGAELSMLSEDALNEYYSYQRRIDEAFAARNEKDLNLLNNQFKDFRSVANKSIEEAKQKMLDDWVKSADLGSAIGGLLTLGTVRTTTTVSEHKITMSTQYQTDFGVSDEQIKSSMDTYLSWMSSSLQSGVNALGYYINDICLRIEYKNVNGKVVGEKEFRVTKATAPAGFNPPDQYYPKQEADQSADAGNGKQTEPGSATITNAPVTQSTTTASVTPTPTATPTPTLTPTPTTTPTPALKLLSVSAIENGLFAAPEIEPKDIQVPEATILSWSGEFKKEKQIDKYSFTAERDGVYCFFFTDILEGQEYPIQIVNASGNAIANQYMISAYGLGEGIDLELSEGQVYTVNVKQSSKYYGNYTINVGVQKEYLSVSECTTVHDSIEFVHQQNGYCFVPSLSGEYRFGLSEIPEGYEYEIQVVNAGGNAISNAYWLNAYGDKEGQTVSLSAGQTYLVKVRQHNHFYGKYCLDIGFYKEVGGVSDYYAVDDSIQFLNQRNIYTFVPKYTAPYSFGISEIPEGYSYLIRVENESGAAISNQYWLNDYKNGESQEVDLKAGHSYSIIIRPYNTAYGAFRLNIGTYREAIVINGYDLITDSFQYRLQRNLYTFTPETDGEYKIKLSGMPDGYSYRIQVENQGGQAISNQYWMNEYKNGDTQRIKLTAGQTYTIIIRQNADYLSEYAISIYK